MLNNSQVIMFDYQEQSSKKKKKRKQKRGKDFSYMRWKLLNSGIKAGDSSFIGGNCMFIWALLFRK